jgi:uncharacterized protein YhdP
VRVKGNLSGFPLDGTEDPLLEIGGHARDVAMEFARDWPRIENISGEFWIRGNKLEVKVPSATIRCALQNLTVTIADLLSDDLPLEEGQRGGREQDLPAIHPKSPCRLPDGFTERASATGHLICLRYPVAGR